MKDAALEWLRKQVKKKDIAMFNALHKKIQSEEEISNIEDAIEIIDYLIAMVERDGTTNAYPTT